MGWATDGVDDTQSNTGWRRQLWQEESVAQLFDTNSLSSTEFLDPEALRSFLERSRTDAFQTHDQWSRVLTLEYTLQRLAACRQSLRTAA